jgi:hypothetical protein
MAIDKEIIALLDDFNLKLQKDTRDSLQKELDARASKHGGRKVKSRLWASVQPVPAIFRNGKILAKLTMNDYWEAVNDGRTETKNGGDGSLRKNLEKWIVSRSIKVEVSKRSQAKAKDLKNRKIRKSYKEQTREQVIKQMAYAMAKNIHKNGIPPTHFFDNVVNDGRIEKLKEDISKIFKAEVLIEIRKTIR